MARVFQLAVAAEYASHESGKSETAEPESQEPRETNNLLLIDEIENGIHHTVQVELWRRLFQLARQHNLQVVATTHSEDCLRGFAQALAEQEEDDGLAIRLEKVEGEVQTGAVIIDRDDLPIVIRDSIEVR